MWRYVQWTKRPIGPVLVLCLVSVALVSCRSAGEDAAVQSASPPPGVSGSRAFVLGGSGVIYLTVDGGASWEQRPSGTTETLFDVAFADARDGWAVGSSGTILHTRDGGMTWAAQQSGLEPAEETLLGVACISPSTAWAVGPDAALFTVDGGGDWLRATAGDDSAASFSRAHDVAFADANVGWAVHGTHIWATRDGGSRWAVVYGGQSNSHGVLLDCITCADCTWAWAGGSVGRPAPGEPEGVLLGTGDGGRNWMPQLETTTAPEAICCTDSRHVWVLTQDVLYRSRDAGLHWRSVHMLPDGAHGVAVDFADAQCGWLVVDSPRGGHVIMASDNGGLNWRQQARIPLSVTDVVTHVEAL